MCGELISVMGAFRFFRSYTNRYYFNYKNSISTQHSTLLIELSILMLLISTVIRTCPRPNRYAPTFSENTYLSENTKLSHLLGLGSHSPQVKPKKLSIYQVITVRFHSYPTKVFKNVPCSAWTNACLFGHGDKTISFISNCFTVFLN